ncbi:MAG: hypothetical protein BGO26_15630 [Actinobacteria bacterium 69-20]|nr:hypothetical protein [Actinomycetota bacterium]OJV28742.1 MAG: hypothetical protein BGO26_15630 [Actinobacteria bacterium 69-20]
MDTTGTGDAAGLAERRRVVTASLAALRSLRSVLYQCTNDQLGALAGELAELRALAGAALAATVAEADARGVIAESHSASVRGWVAEVAPHARREASMVAACARVLRRDELSAAADALCSARLDLPTAAVIAGEYDKLAPDLAAGVAPVVLGHYIAVGADHGPGAVRRLTEQLLATYGDEGEFDAHADRCRRHIHLSAGRPVAPGLWDYRLTVDGEGRSVLEAAIGPLSAPCPDGATGERDMRPVPRRRGEALIAVLARSATAAGRVPTGAKAVLMVTMDFHALRDELRAGVAVGTRADGTPLAPATVRKLACDAAIIPAVLGGRGEVLDQGRTVRLFTLGQIRALWKRDRHCTFDGCDIPAAWCDAHHLLHWADGGPTDIATNAALLCPRHHTVVHRDRLAGRIVDGAIEWNRHAASYDEELAEHRTPNAPPGSGPPPGAGIAQDAAPSVTAWSAVPPGRRRAGRPARSIPATATARPAPHRRKQPRLGHAVRRQ